MKKTNVVHTPLKQVPVCEIVCREGEDMPVLVFKKPGEQVYEEMRLDSFFSFLFRAVFAAGNEAPDTVASQISGIRKYMKQ